MFDTTEVGSRNKIKDTYSEKWCFIVVFIDNNVDKQIYKYTHIL
jgi:hypothetical protein